MLLYGGLWACPQYNFDFEELCGGIWGYIWDIISQSLNKKSVLWIYIFRDRLMLFYVGLGACLKKILISVSSVVASEGIFWIEFHNLWTKNITLCGYKFSIICNKWRIDDILWGFVGTPSRKVWISGSSVVASEGILGLEFQTFELKKSLFVDINVPLYAI